MPYMKSSRIICAAGGRYEIGETGGETSIFSDSQFLPARDGTWLMVDYISESGNWYITEGV